MIVAEEREPEASKLKCPGGSGAGIWASARNVTSAVSRKGLAVIFTGGRSTSLASSSKLKYGSVMAGELGETGAASNVFGEKWMVSWNIEFLWGWMKNPRQGDRWR